jgi:hypothetical protein
LRNGQISCGCARGGPRTPNGTPQAIRTGMRKWTPEIEAEVLRAHALGLGATTIARHLCVGRTAVRAYLVECGRLEDVSEEPKPEKPKAEWPAGMKFEDMPPSRKLNNEKFGPKPKRAQNQSLTGCSAFTCLGA